MDDAAFLRLVSGETRGVFASLKRCGLRGLSFVYGAAVGLRNLAYSSGLKRSRRAGVPVVSVGNLTTGGTGKTPFVAYLAQHFRAREEMVVLLSRGYKSRDGEGNDEKLVLDRLCPGVPHLQRPDRAASAAIAVAEHRATVLILDDGFQHRRLHRDVDLVLIDATCPWGYGHLLPRGLLREPVGGLRRAHAVVLTRVDQVDESRLKDLRERIRAIHPNVPVAEVSYPAVGLRGADGEARPLSELAGRKAIAFCGIGNPRGFWRELDKQGVELSEAGRLTFPDHHHYAADDTRRIETVASDEEASLILTTLKDLVKIDRRDIGGVPLWAVDIGVRFHAGEPELRALLEARITASRRRA